MKIGYARVSTIGQSLETQKEILEKNGCEKFFVEKVSGTSTKHRIQLKEAIEFLREGDILVVTKIDRLARSIIDLNNIINKVMDKKADIHFLSEDIRFKSNSGNDSLQTLLFNILGSFAQFERDMIVERTTEGRERAKRQGKHLGRPSQPKNNIEKAIKFYNERETNRMSVNDIVKLTGVPKSTLYVELKKGNI